MLYFLLGTVYGLRLEHGIPTASNTLSQSLFCTSFILTKEGGNFAMLEGQFKKCDNYAFLSTFTDEAHNITKIMDVAPTGSHLNHKIAEPMWTHLTKYADKYDWFLKVDWDTFLRPSMMRLSLQGWNSKEAVAVGRLGRNSGGRRAAAGFVGAAYALSGLMVKQLQTKHLDAAKVEAGTWHGEDTLVSAWIPLVGGQIKNAINADNSCTSFSTTDKKELPTQHDIEQMKAGQSYTKSAGVHDNSKLGDICYSSSLAAIHPVKNPTQYAQLLKDLELS